MTKMRIEATNVKTREVCHFDSLKQLELAGFDYKCVRKCITGKQVQHLGWIFREVEHAA